MRTRLASHSECRDILLKAGYLVALLLVVVPVADALARTWPVRIGDERWRFGTMGIVLNAMVTPLLGVFLAMVTAALLEHGRTLQVIAVVTLVAAAAALAGIIGFALDYIQLRASVTDEALAGFDAAARKAILVGLLGGGVTLALGISGWRAARRITLIRPGEDVGLVVSNEEKA